MASKFRFYVDGVLKEVSFPGLIARDENFDLIDIDGNIYVPKAPQSDTTLTLPGSIWFKEVGATLEMYYGALKICVVDAVSGNLIYGIGNVSVVPVESGGTGGATQAAARTGLGLLSAAVRNTGTGVNEVLMFSESGKLPALDGSLLTNLPIIPVGTVIYTAMNTPPTGFLKANGAALVRATYDDLFDVIGITYGAGDGSTTFVLPDLRGEFIRGWDDGRGVDTSRVFGSSQLDTLKAHTHNNFYSNYTATGTGYSFSGVQPAGYLAVATSSTGDSETRPRNVALLACIKY